ncbi:MAG: HAMP domain-containing histidine kinase [Lachnospiraceae bacterium]|nr:HAMP domain-containing histidine kinase [Lachnospiraceae bacterium]
MIYKLRNKFILISALSPIAVLVCIYLALFFINTSQLDSNMDSLTDMIMFENDRPPNFAEPPMDIPGPGSDQGRRPGRMFINKETRFTTRFFTVEYNSSGEIIRTNIDNIASVTEDQAKEYADDLLASSTERGWVSSYRYKVMKGVFGTRMVFVDGTGNRELSAAFLLTSALVLFGSGAVVLLLIIFFSRKAVKPVAESYEKQKQFVTDANHELKTPLTLILANLDIAESELGKNEWLDDIRYEGEQMATLVERLVTLSRMDEDSTSLTFSNFNLSETLLDVTSEFASAAKNAGKQFTTDIKSGIEISGDEAAIRQVTSILLDNALKYCDKSGIICCSLVNNGRSKEITVTNSFKEVDNTELDRLFDRFYRSNKARTSGTGFGIGLSIAKATVTKHGGDICAYKAASGVIGFRITL